MKRLLFASLLLLCATVDVHANGVCFEDASTGMYLELIESDVDVRIENQVGIVTTTQRFRNTLGAPFTLTYAFPLAEGASATALSWQIGAEWEEAVIDSGGPPHIPGSDDMDPDLASYLGPTPLFFRCPSCTVGEESTFRVRLTYVQLLPYEFGSVDFFYPNDYSRIQHGWLDVQRLHLDLVSPRTIEEIELLSHAPADIVMDDHHAVVDFERLYSSAGADYHARYRLSLSELGLFGMSSRLDPGDVPDDLGNGFFTFVAEPEPDTSIVLDKVFTLIVDRSGSMLGSKIEQARDAASFIVEHLNPGDRFNVVDFATNVASFSDSHVPFTPETRDQAIEYISGFLAADLTNISGAFSLAVPQFIAADDTTANIIIFFTDGKPTTGIVETEALLAHVHDLIVSTETRICLFTFGIGAGVNRQLLTRMASENDGLSVFLGDDELEQVITDFYLRIQSPVLVDTYLTFSPEGVISEVYPDPVPDLYQGSQMIVSGRYREPVSALVTLNGEKFGWPVAYEYDMMLATSSAMEYQFLPKLWAKVKIEHLLIQYYSLDPESPEAEALKEEIIALSLSYGVMSPFTHFGSDDPDDPDDPGDGGDGDETPIENDEEIGGDVPPALGGPYRLLGNHPNPFNPWTTIEFVVSIDLDRDVFVRIYDLSGRLVRQLTLYVDDPGRYSVLWDGTTTEGVTAPSGVYLYAVDFGDAVLVGKMLMAR
jgi:Ca-activated chloride channel family protein